MLKTVSSATNAIGALNFKGTWNASTNTPTIVSGVGVKGDYFVVGVAGTTTIDGISNWGIGDWIAYNGNIWQRVEGGADLNGVNLSVSGTTTLSGLTASTALALDASKNVASVTNTGTGNNVLADGPTLTSPRVVTSLNDTNGNELFGITATASAVNELTVANAATGSNPVISSTGSDTDIGITLAPKGAGKILAAAGTNWAGTVSQSTQSAVIERGSNANGEFVKYADGTLICISAQQSLDFTGSVQRVLPSYPASPASGAPASGGICMDDVGTTSTDVFSAAAIVGVSVRANAWNYAKNSTINSAGFTATMRLFLISRWY